MVFLNPSVSASPLLVSGHIMKHQTLGSSGSASFALSQPHHQPTLKKIILKSEQLTNLFRLTICSLPYTLRVGIAGCTSCLIKTKLPGSSKHFPTCTVPDTYPYSCFLSSYTFLPSFSRYKSHILPNSHNLYLSLTAAFHLFKAVKLFFSFILKVWPH